MKTAEQRRKRKMKTAKREFSTFFGYVKAGLKGSGVTEAEVPMRIEFDDSMGPRVADSFNQEPPSGWVDQVQSGVTSIVNEMNYKDQGDESTLQRVFNTLLGQKLAAQVKTGLRNEVDAVVPYGHKRTLVELKIGADIKKACRQIAVYEAQRLGLAEESKREQNRTRETYCVFAARGFGDKCSDKILNAIFVRRIKLHFPENQAPTATVSAKRSFLIFPGEFKYNAALEFYNLFRSLGEIHRFDGGVDSEDDDE
eukprot:Gregarina_sp_Poly_1__6649@NODE_3579_length_994_cov_2679_776699_g2274_i0_p1_GENE_NODE_3579_length_994_cov_2679_776699_g2274_i0NODE_3579_length_994_cov_2679_776699_g2274_i0_p1_ORF_typecomplete_len291_score49_45_NODE_3579_length_994_cov_2679_776699_g2274_i0122883